MKKIDLICIVDDDPFHIYSTKKILEVGKFCHSILIFKNGKEAFDTLSAIFTSSVGTLPDLILLDINMPVWDGWDFLDSFMEIPIQKNITIFMVSSSDNPADFQRAATYENVNGFIVKPITEAKLREELEGVI